MAVSTSSPTRAVGSAPSFAPLAGLPRPKSPSNFMARWAPPPREQEKRQCRRRSLRCKVVLIDGGTEDKDNPVVIPAECLNVGDGGLYAMVRMGYGVAIGKRYTFRLTIGERGPEPDSGQVVSQRGEVVRAELLLGEDGYADRVGIGVRLFGPRSGLVPMPTRM